MTAETPPPDRRYALAGPLNWRLLDSTWLVHSSASGATLAADAVDAVLLEFLGDGPASVADLTAQLAGASDAVLPPDAAQGIEARLLAWVQQGLVVLDD